MHFVLYAAPNYTENAVKFIDKLASIPDIRLGLISQEPSSWLKPELQARLHAFAQVEDAFSEMQLIQAARQLIEKHGPVHRILGATEQIQIPVAAVRETLGIAGMGVETMLNFRDKSRMKNLLRKANIPCAHHQLVSGEAEALAFTKKNGYPVIVKPPDGAASQVTFKAASETELKAALLEINPSPEKPALLEEFITGDEFSFDTFSLNGKPVFHTLTHYYPNPLTVVREPWIQWQILLPAEVDHPRYDDIKAANAKTLKTLGMETGLTHLEWFRRADGSIAISEVAARPPGAQITTMISRANDFDSVTAWARLMIFDEFEIPQRKYAVGAAFLRGQGQGKVTAVHGLEAVQKEVGHLITDVRIPTIGQSKGLTYEGEGYIILRHPETAVVREALSKVVSTVRVVLG